MIARPTLSAWQNAAFTDQNSLSQDPFFVDARRARTTWWATRVRPTMAATTTFTS